MSSRVALTARAKPARNGTEPTIARALAMEPVVGAKVPAAGSYTSAVER